jgi:hypothetical protein
VAPELRLLLLRLLEFGVIGALYALVVRHGEIRADLRKLSSRATGAMYGLGGYFVVAALAQCFILNQYEYPQRTELFPFTRWAMFSFGSHASQSDFTIFEFQGIDRSGESVTLNPARLFLTPNAVVLFTKTDSLGRQIGSGSPAVQERASQALRYFMEGLRRRFEAQHPGRKLGKIVLWGRRISLRAGTEIPEPFTEPNSFVVLATDYPRE